MSKTIHAPHLKANHLPWFNVKAPLDLPDLKGKLVILDFWTFCCINCIHIIPTLKRIEAKHPKSVVVIGVHSPKFPGERRTDNLQQAIARYEIEHPVVQDTEFSIWKAYVIRAWPTLVFVGPDGYFLGQLPGEPDPEMLEATVDKLLEDYKKQGLLEGNAAKLLQAPPLPASGQLRFPGKIAYSAEDKEFAIADSNHNQVVTVDRSGRVTRRVGSGEASRRDGAYAVAGFYRPQGLCYNAGIIWVADTENHLIRKIDLARQEVTSVAGTGLQGVCLEERGVDADKVALSSPWDVAFRNGRIYFANAGTHQIGVLHIETRSVRNFAGTGREGLFDGLRLKGALAQPSGLCVGEDKLFFADSETSSIRSVDLDSVGQIETYAGTGLFDFGDLDGIGKEAVLQHPLGIHCADGVVYIADSYNHKIKTLDLKSREVRTLESSVNIVCGDKSCSRLWEPAGVIAVEKCLYVSDTNNHRIIKINLLDGKSEVFVGGK